MSTLLRQLDEKMLELLNADGSVAAAQDERTFALDGEKDLPARVLRRIQTLPNDAGISPNDVLPTDEDIQSLITTYAVDCYGRAGTGERPTQSADAMVSASWKTVVAQAQSTGDDPRLFWRIRFGGIVPTPAQSDHPYSYTRLLLHVYHQSRADDPEAWE